MREVREGKVSRECKRMVEMGERNRRVNIKPKVRRWRRGGEG